jgi:putative membrane protein
MNKNNSPDSRQQTTLTIAALIVIGVLIMSGTHPHDRATWVMEVLPVIIALPILAGTYRRFPLTHLLYGLIFLHALILIVGGTYSYARVPVGFWVQDMLSLSRNPYDKLGHFAQGLIPAMLAKEILRRGGYVVKQAGRRNGGQMLAFLSVHGTS